MKRLAWTILALLGSISPALAFDGPGTVTYDQTVNGIRVVLTTQGKILRFGRTNFTMTAYVPIVASTVGQSVTVEIRKPASPTDLIVKACAFVPTVAEVGATAVYTCDGFEVVPGILAATTSVNLYPVVTRGATVPGEQLEHNGLAAKLTIPVVGDDAYENNDTELVASDLGTLSTPFSRTDLVWLDVDYFKFVAPAGAGSAEIAIQFWHQVTDLDLYVYDSSGNLIGASIGIDDEERVIIAVTPSQTYYVDVEAYDANPAFYDLSLFSSAPHLITITSGPGGSPNPVLSGGLVNLFLSASDSLGHALSISWRAHCPELDAAGSFSNVNITNPTWTAPINATGVQKTCAIRVDVSDNLGTSLQGTFTQRVDPADHSVTITAGPTGLPNPVATSGTVVLSLTASDTFGHALSYAWQATCPDLGSSGTFTPSATDPAPVWSAPANSTGAARNCTISVTANDGRDKSATGSYEQRVDPFPHVITITAGPSGTPNPVATGGSVFLNVSATDTLPHSLAYSWQASCPGLGSSGSFLPNPAVQTPDWTAPTNLTGLQQFCTLTVTVSDGQGLTKSGSFQQAVSTASNVVAITAGPTGTPNPVGTSGVAAMAVVATDLLGRPLTYKWTAACPGLGGNGTFSNPAAESPTWTAPANLTGSQQACTVAVTVGDGQGSTKTASFLEFVNVDATCSFSVAPTSADVSKSGGAGTTAVTTGPGCGWTATSHAAWLAVTGPPSGVGSGAVGYAAAANTAPGPRTGTLTVAGQTVTLTQAGAGYTYYFAEGATIGGFFATRLALLNTDPTAAATVTLDFQLKDTPTVLTHGLSLGPHQRATIDVATLGTVNPALAPLASAEFSTVVRSNVPLVADRTMTWDKSGYGSHAETSIDAPASTWYLAEGATIGDFELYYLIQNPNPTPLTNEIEVTYLLPPPAAPLVRTYSMGPNTRRNIVVHAEPGLENAEVSAIIRTPADKPVIVERAMYLTAGGLFYGAGHESAGIRAPAPQWFFAEGATGDFFDLFILIGNPNPTGAQVTATFLFDDGTTCSTRVGSTVENGELVVGPQSRYNIWVDALTIPGCPRSLANAAVSTTITSNLPVIAERTMWWPGPTAAHWAEAHNAPGATATGTLWALADGEQGGPRSTETYVLIANTAAYAGTARVTLYFEDGTTVAKDLLVTANSRATVAVGAAFGAAVQHRRFGLTVESLPVAGQPGPAPLVVERAMYSNGPGAPFWAAGTDVLATRVR